jgi:hypothetical protein
MQQVAIFPRVQQPRRTTGESLGSKTTGVVPPPITIAISMESPTGVVRQSLTLVPLGRTRGSSVEVVVPFAISSTPNGSSASPSSTRDVMETPTTLMSVFLKMTVYI